MILNKKLKILQVAPIDIEISPNLKYAGTERIIDFLNRAYHKKGHSSYVLASGDSDLGGYGTLIFSIEKSLWAMNNSENEREMIRSESSYENHFKKSLEYSIKNNIDIIHNHPGQFLIGSDEFTKRKRLVTTPIITTLHCHFSQDDKKKFDIFKKIKEENPVYFLGISDFHMKKCEKELGINLDGFVYNGLPLESFEFKEKKQDYLFWIGRLSDIKGTDLAIKIAQKSKRPLIIAGEVHTPYKNFYNEKVFPYLTNQLKGNSLEDLEKKKNELIDKIDSGERLFDSNEIYFIGPVNDIQKAKLYSNAYSVLVPNRWEEPFGLTMIEGMATGTPCLGTNLGAIPEIIKDSKTGYVIEVPSLKKDNNYSEKELIEKFNDKCLEEELIERFRNKLNEINKISPYECRKHIENNFSSSKMADSYLKFYYDVLNGRN